MGINLPLKLHSASVQTRNILAALGRNSENSVYNEIMYSTKVLGQYNKP
jgi:hypothetical protein